jgi:hypothetical protein
MDIKKELEVVGNYPSMFGGFPGNPKYNTPVTPLENIRLALKRDASGALKGEQIWEPQGGDVFTFCTGNYPDVIARGFTIESKMINNDTEAGGPDMFGIEWEWVQAVQGSMVRPGSEPFHDDPDAFLEWEKYLGKEINGTKFIWPNIDDWDWEAAAERNKSVLEDKSRSIMPWVFTGFFERLISLMNFQNAAVAMIDEDMQEAIHRLFDKLCGLYDQMFEKFNKYFGATMVYFHDDWGSQQKSFLKPETYDEMIVPYLKRVCESLHKRGMYINFHSCGKIEPLVPLMIKANVDIWSGQPMNDRLQVLKDNHGKIYVEFGPEATGMMVQMSPEEQEKNVNDWLAIYGDYIDSIFVNTSFGGTPVTYKVIYEYSRKKFNRSV